MGREVDVEACGISTVDLFMSLAKPSHYILLMATVVNAHAGNSLKHFVVRHHPVPESETSIGSRPSS